MSERPFVIMLVWRHPVDVGVNVFVGSSWDTVEQFVKDNCDFDTNDRDWYWWAQVQYIDEADIIRSCGEVRTYRNNGTLWEQDLRD
jgi:hypothetical protein